MRFHQLCTAVAVACVAAAAVVGAQQSTQSPAASGAASVIGPVALTSAVRDAAHGYPFNASTLDLQKQGYVEEEFFIRGSARSYDIPRDQMSNGTANAATHPYVARLVVRRPAAAGKFNGTAIVEWTNVSEGFDNEVDWFHSADHLVNAGYAWVGVSAQNVGVSAMKQWSPSRYSSLDVTDGGTVMGDALSYDIFTAAGQAVRGRAAASVMGSLKVQRVIATGHSQSAGRLATYFNAVHPLAPVYDAVVLHGGGGKMRTDLGVKIWKLLSETDVLGQVAARQPDSDKFRTWAVAVAEADRPLAARPVPLTDATTRRSARFHRNTSRARCTITWRAGSRTARCRQPRRRSRSIRTASVRPSPATASATPSGVSGLRNTQWPRPPTAARTRAAASAS